MSYIKWDIIKSKLNSNLNKKRGVNLIEDLDVNLLSYTEDLLNAILNSYNKKEILSSIDKYTIEKINFILDYRKKYYFRTPYYNILSVKLILPVPCQANCSFCYYNHKDYGNSFDKEMFLTNFISSLKYAVKRAHGKPLSLDITGGEPTFDLELLSKVINKIKESNIKKDFKRITLTSNGFRIIDALPIISGVVDYVNISLHDIDFNERQKIFKTSKILNNDQLDNIVSTAFIDYGIKISSVFVVDDLNIDKLNVINEWCYNIGFVTNRIRYNVYENAHYKRKANELVLNGCGNDDKYQVIYAEQAPEADFSIVTYKNNLTCFIMDGIPETYSKTYGIELLVRTDGKVYLDYNGTKLLSDYPYFPINYVSSLK